MGKKPTEDWQKEEKRERKMEEKRRREGQQLAKELGGTYVNLDDWAKEQARAGKKGKRRGKSQRSQGSPELGHGEGGEGDMEMGEGGFPSSPDHAHEEVHAETPDQARQRAYTGRLHSTFEYGLPPLLRTPEFAHLSTATFVLPQLTKEGDLSWKEVHCCGFAEVLGEEGGTEHMFFCDCCQEKKFAYQTAQWRGDLAGGCSDYVSGDKARHCEHTKVLNDVIQNSGGFEFVMRFVTGTPFSASP